MLELRELGAFRCCRLCSLQELMTKQSLCTTQFHLKNKEIDKYISCGYNHNKRPIWIHLGLVYTNYGDLGKRLQGPTHGK